MEKPEIQQQLDQRILQKIGAAQQEQVQQGDQALAQAAPGSLAPPPQPGAALQGMGNAPFAGQGLPFAPAGPGMPAIASNGPMPPTGPGLPSVPPGAPGGQAMAQAANLQPPGVGAPLGP
jgi:hypothetical protein